MRTGSVAGVAVMRENRLAGVTRKNGLLLVENIAPQVPMTFDIDPERLPPDALARATHRRIVVPRRAIGLVALDVVHFRPRQIRVTGPDGADLPVGTVLIAQPSGEQVLVGFEGLVDFNTEGGDTRIERHYEGGARCVVDTADLSALPDGAVAQRACRIELNAEIVARDPAGGKRAAPRGRAVGGRRR